jgi:hypothetical protein
MNEISSRPSSSINTIVISCACASAARPDTPSWYSCPGPLRLRSEITRNPYPELRRQRPLLIASNDHVFDQSLGGRVHLDGDLPQPVPESGLQPETGLMPMDIDTSCPEDFEWALGAQSPSLLSHLFTSIVGACRAPQSKPRSVIRLVRKPEGNSGRAASAAPN